jgi:hypothetical protein
VFQVLPPPVLFHPDHTESRLTWNHHLNLRKSDIVFDLYVTRTSQYVGRMRVFFFVLFFSVALSSVASHNAFPVIGSVIKTDASSEKEHDSFPKLYMFTAAKRSAIGFRNRIKYILY